MSSQENRKTIIEEIVGEPLDSVEFVQDYVQLRFNGACLTAYTNPEIVIGERVWRWGEPGYRDTLCAQITHLVKSVAVSNEAIEVIFDNGVKIQVSLKDSDREGPEAAVHTGRDGKRFMVF